MERGIIVASRITEDPKLVAWASTNRLGECGISFKQKRVEYGSWAMVIEDPPEEGDHGPGEKASTRTQEIASKPLSGAANNARKSGFADTEPRRVSAGSPDDARVE